MTKVFVEQPMALPGSANYYKVYGITQRKEVLARSNLSGSLVQFSKVDRKGK